MFDFIKGIFNFRYRKSYRGLTYEQQVDLYFYKKRLKLLFNKNAAKAATIDVLNAEKDYLDKAESILEDHIIALRMFNGADVYIDRVRNSFHEITIFCRNLYQDVDQETDHFNPGIVIGTVEFSPIGARFSAPKDSQLLRMTPLYVQSVQFVCHGTDLDKLKETADQWVEAWGSLTLPLSVV